jgi:methyltransferase (TIGR00027 family)
MSQLAAIQSAETVAALRALAGSDDGLLEPCRDLFAGQFLSFKSRLLLNLAPHGVLRRLIERAAPGSYCFTIARTRHFDEALLAGIRGGIEQVVILGAGYDSRAFRFKNELGSIKVFELDHPGTQARKKALLESSNAVLPDNLTLIGIDFAKQSFRKLLPEHGFRSDAKTLFLWEGVSYYLPLPAIDDVLKFVAGCAPGSSVVFDYALQSFVDGDTRTYGGAAVARWLEKIGEPFLFGLHPVDAQNFLAKRGLRVVSHVGPADIENLYLATHHGGMLGRTLGHVRIIEAQTAAA